LELTRLHFAQYLAFTRHLQSTFGHNKQAISGLSFLYDPLAGTSAHFEPKKLKHIQQLRKNLHALDQLNNLLFGQLFQEVIAMNCVPNQLLRPGGLGVMLERGLMLIQFDRLGRNGQLLVETLVNFSCR
jgi:hypothetical protein